MLQFGGTWCDKTITARGTSKMADQLICFFGGRRFEHQVLRSPGQMPCPDKVFDGLFKWAQLWLGQVELFGDNPRFDWLVVRLIDEFQD